MLLIGTAAKLRTVGAVDQVSVAEALIKLTDSIKNLGMLLYSELTLNEHVGKVCLSAYFRIMVRCRVRGSLSPDVVNTIACAIVGASLDYCNRFCTVLRRTAYHDCSVHRTHSHALSLGRRISIISPQRPDGYTCFPSDRGSKTVSSFLVETKTRWPKFWVKRRFNSQLYG